MLLKTPEDNTAQAGGSDEFVIKPLQFYWKSFWQFPFLMSCMIIMEIGQAAMLVMMPYSVREIVQRADSYSPALGVPLWDHIHGAFMMLVVVTIAMAVFSRISGTILIFVAKKLRREPRIWLFNHLLDHSVDYFMNRHSGSLGAKIHDVTSGVAMATWTLLFEFLALVILFAASVVTIGMVYMPLAVLIGVWGIVYGTVISLMTIPRAYWIERTSKARAAITGVIIDAVVNVLSLKAFARKDYEKKILRQNMKEEEFCNVRFGLWGEAIHWTHFTLTFVLIVGSIFYMVEKYEGGAIDLATISYVFTLVLILSNNARNLTWSLQSFMEYVGQIRDGIRTIMTPHDIADDDNQAVLSCNKGHIHYQNITFAYEGLKQKVVINNLDLDIKPGMKIGLVGPSGAGKSTMVNLLLRFYEPDKGRIVIDGQDVGGVTQDSLRDQIAMIPQDTSLFHRSLMENIRYGRLDATDEEVMEAARKAHAHDFIAELPEAYETLVGERGVKLSGGQRQRIAIARAILKDAPILVLDEATSALDSESEKLIQDSLAQLMEGKTVIAIAHRLSTIAHLDQLIVMNDGQITEQGSHEELLKEKGLYARLWDMQSGGFLVG